MGTEASLQSHDSVIASRHSFPQVGYVAKVALVAALYLIAGKIGLSVPFTSSNVSPVWPASGVALACLLLWGYKVWPGIALGAFLVNFLSPIPPLAALGIAIGNTSSALLGNYLLRRFAGFQISLTRLRDVLGLVVVALASPVIAGTVGATSLRLAQVTAWAGFGSAWRIWWLGDAMGILIVTPLFLTVRDLAGLRRSRLIELGSLLLGLMATGLVVFGAGLGLRIQDDVLAFIVFPFVIWAAIRFQVAGVSIATFVTTTIAVWGMAEGRGPFGKYDALHDASLLQLFIAVVSVTGLILAAVIAERKRTQETLLEQAELLDLANDAILVRGLDDTIGYWNQGAERMYGWSPREVLGKPVHEILRTEFREPLSEIKEVLLRDGKWQGELTHFKRDGSAITVGSRWSLWKNREGKPLGFLELNTDITNRKLAEQNLRELSGRLLRMQDEERRRIARELHDSAGQLLTALDINLVSIRKEAGQLSTRASDACRESESLIRELSKELRTISYLLHPPLLDEAGLPSAIRWYVEGFAERSKIRVNLELPDDMGRFAPEAETAIFRVIQESLTNVHRHSGSPTASVRIVRDEREVSVEIGDKGNGMRIAQARPGASKVGVGIQGMRERIRQLGGGLEIVSGKNGTVVTVTLPIDASVLAAGKGLAS